MNSDDTITNTIRPKFGNRNSKRRRYGLTCVVCQAPACGFHFAQISCRSCKEFFRRTALIPLEKLKCKNISMTNRCQIRFNMKIKCRHCRLRKCFEAGMNTDHFISETERLSKQRAREKNHSATLPIESITSPKDNPMLTDIDRTCLSDIQSSYSTAIQSIPSASSTISFEPSLNKTYCLSHVIELDTFTTRKLIHFLRLIPEFEQLHEQDRLSLVKYNIIPLLVLRDVLVYNRTNDLLYDDNVNSIRTLNDEQFARSYHCLYLLFYGYEETKLYMSHVRSIAELTDNDPLIVQLLMLVLIFLPGTMIDHEQAWSLIDSSRVFHVHSKYVDLLFRYLITKYSFEGARKKMNELLRNIFRIQIGARLYKELIRNRDDNNDIHPLIKTILGIN